MINWEDQNQLLSLTHLDGRNAPKLAPLRPYFSEYAWMKTRIMVMVKFAVYICQKFTKNIIKPTELLKLTRIYENFTQSEAKAIQKIEKTTNHDLKSIEIWLSGKLKDSGLSKYLPYLNLTLGSEDINNLALSLSLKNSRGDVILKDLSKIVGSLSQFVRKERNSLILARTHAVAANVTTLGKEFANPLLRLCDELKIFMQINFRGKISGEVGSFQAGFSLDPGFDWLKFQDQFIGSLGLLVARGSTQIVPYDTIARYLQSLWRINSILLDLSKNVWLYVLLGYLTIEKIEQEVGSAGMPHKINPIYFEGSEGGLTMANGIIETLTRKLMENRLQRDFSDSTVRRNIVLPLALSLLSYQSLVTGLSRIRVNHGVIENDLTNHPEAWIETIKVIAIQSGVSDAYVKLKEASRGKNLSLVQLSEIISSMKLDSQNQIKLSKIITRKLINPIPARICNQAVNAAKKYLNL